MDGTGRDSAKQNKSEGEWQRVSLAGGYKNTKQVWGQAKSVTNSRNMHIELRVPKGEEEGKVKEEEGTLDHMEDQRQSGSREVRHIYL